MPALVVQVELIDPTDAAVAGRLLELQKMAYRLEAELIGFDGIPPLHETLGELVSQPLEWHGIRSSGRIVAAIGYAIDGGVCDIDRLFVDPDHFGQEYASTLVASLLHHPHIIVQTGTANLPARRLYEKHGFRSLGEVEIAPGVTVTRYERRR